MSGEFCRECSPTLSHEDITDILTCAVTMSQ